MLSRLRVHLDQVYGGVAAVSFLVTTAALHLAVPKVTLFSLRALLLLAVGTVACAGVVGAVGAGLRRLIAVQLGRAGISPRTHAAARCARVIAAVLVGVDIVLAFAFAWIAFTFVYGPLSP